MLIISVAALVSLIALVACDKNYTVTSEVIFDVEVKNYNTKGDDLYGQVVVGLFGDTVPIACLNFKAICEGFKRPNEEKICYKNTICHRSVKDMYIQCGDVFNLDGYGTTSVYGEQFNDENFDISHRSGGIVTMANKGKDTNGSQFLFTLGASRFLDGKHVGIGKVVRGYKYLAAINRMGPLGKTQQPRRTIRILECKVNDIKKYELSEKDTKTDDLEGIVAY